MICSILWYFFSRYSLKKASKRVLILGMLTLALIFLQIKPFPPLIASDTYNPQDEIVYLLADIEKTGWSDEERRHYAELRQSMGDSEALMVWMAGREQFEHQDSVFLRHLTELAIARMDWIKAKAYLENLVSIDADDMLSHYQLGLLLASEDAAEALSHLHRSSQNADLAPLAQAIITVLEGVRVWDVEAYQRIGLALVDIAAWPFAEKAFDAVLEKDNQYWQAYSYRGYARDQQGKNGYVDYTTAIGLAPSAAQAYYFLGLYWRNIDIDFVTSRDVLVNAYQLDPNNPALAAEVATAYQRLGDLFEAAKWFNLAVELAGGDVEWYRLQAAFYAENNYLLDSAGLSILQESYQKFPQDSHIVTSLAYAHYLLQRYHDATAFFNLAFDLDENNARTYYYYGLFQENLNNRVLASEAYQSAIDLAGADTGYGYLAARALEQLRLLP